MPSRLKSGVDMVVLAKFKSEFPNTFYLFWDRYRGKFDTAKNVFLVYSRIGLEWFHIVPWSTHQSPEIMRDALAQQYGDSIGNFRAGGILTRETIDFTICEVSASEVADLIRLWHWHASSHAENYPISYFLDAQVCIFSESTSLGTVRQVVREGLS